MPVHSIHIFDRKGKTLFTKRFTKAEASENVDPEFLAEQRKLVFGMLFSLREVASSLSPNSNDENNNSNQGGLHSVRTGASTLYNYETNSGLRFALYCANPSTTDGDNTAATTPDSSVRAALEYVYNELWIHCVTRSPLYRPTQPNVDETNFEVKLTSFLRAQPWFR